MIFHQNIETKTFVRKIQVFAVSGKHLLNLGKVKGQRIFYPTSTIVLLQVFCFDLFSWPSPQAPREQVDIYALVQMPVIR